jgi:hypothetical protein
MGAMTNWSETSLGSDDGVQGFHPVKAGNHGYIYDVCNRQTVVERKLRLVRSNKLSRSPCQVRCPKVFEMSSEK